MMARLLSVLLVGGTLWGQTTPNPLELVHATGGIRHFTEVAVTADASLAAAATQNGLVLLWDVASGRELRRFTTGDVTGLAFSQDSSLLAIKGKKSLVVYDLQARESLLNRFNDFIDDCCHSVYFSTDGKHLYLDDWAITVDTKARSVGNAQDKYGTRPQLESTWDIISAHWWAMDRTQAAAGFVRKAETSGTESSRDDSDTAPTRFDKQYGAILYDPAEGTLRQAFDGLPAEVTALVVSPDSTHVAISTADGTLHIGDVDRTSRVVHVRLNTAEIPFGEKGVIREHLPLGTSLRWVSWPGNAAVLQAISADGKFLKIDGATGNIEQKFSVAQDALTKFSFSPGGRFVVTAEDGARPVSRVTDLASGKETGHLDVVADPIDFSAASADGQMLVAAGGNDVTVWNLSAGLLTHKLRVDGKISLLTVSPDGQFVCFGLKDTGLRIWNLSTGDVNAIRSDSPMLAAAFLHNEPLLATTHADRKLRFWTMLGQPAAADQDLPGDIGVLKFDPGDTVAALASHENAWLRYLDRDNATVELKAAFDSTKEESLQSVQHLEFSTNGATLIVSKGNRSIDLFDVETAKRQKEKEIGDLNREREGPVESIGFSSSGDLLLAVLHGTVHVIATADWDEIAAVGSGIRSAYFTDGGRLLVTQNEDDSLSVWEWTSRAPDLVHDEERPVTAVAWSRNNNRIVTARTDGRAEVIDMQNENNPRLLEGHSQTVHSVATSDDGNLTVTGGEDGTVRFWYTSKAPNTRRTKLGVAKALAVSPDRKLVASVSEKIGSVWSLPDLAHVATLETKGDLHAIAISSTGDVLAGSSDHSAYLCDGTSGRQKKVLQHEKAVLAVAFSADGRRAITGSADQTAVVWDAVSGKKFKEQRTSAEVTAVALTADGSAAIIGNANGEVMIWALDSESLPVTLFKHAKAVTALALSPDGDLLLSGSADHQTRLFRLSSRATLWQREFEASVTSAAFSPRGERILIGLHKHAAVVIDAMNSEIPYQLGGAQKYFDAAVFVGNDWALLGDRGGNTVLWEIATGMQSRTVFQSSKPIRSVVVSRDGKTVLAGGDEGLIQRIDSMTLARQTILSSFPAGVNAIAQSADGSRVIVGGRDGRAQVYDLLSGRPLGPAVLHRGGVNSVAIDSQGQWAASGGEDFVAQAWKIDNGNQPVEMEHGAPVRSVALSDTRLVASASEDGTTRIWKPENGESVRWLRLDHPTAVAFSKGGDYVLVAGHSGLHLAATDPGQQKDILDGHFGAVTASVFSPDQRIAFSVGKDGRLIRWDVAKALPIQTQRLKNVANVVFSANGKWALGARDRSLAMWPLGEDSNGSATRHFQMKGNSLGHAISPDGSLIASVSDQNNSRALKALTWGTLGFSSIVTDDRKVKPELLTIWEARDEKQVCTANFEWGNSDPAFNTRFFMNDPRAEDSWLLFDPNGKRLYVRLADRFRVYDTQDCHEVFGEVPDDTTAMALSATGGLMATASRRGFFLTDRKNGTRWQFPGLEDCTVIGFSPDEHFVLVGDSYHQISVWSTLDGRQIRRFIGHEATLTAISVSTSGIVLTASKDGTLRTWNLAAESNSLRLASKPPQSISWLPDSLAVRIRDAREDINVWDPERALVKMMSFSDGSWFCLSQDGRFDTNRLEDNRGVHWLAADAPRQPLPLDLYARDYFEPDLVSRIIVGSEFRPLRPREDLNRTRPTVNIRTVEPSQSAASVWVTVEAQDITSATQKDVQGRPLQSGIYDLRLFRDGHLIGLAKPEGLRAEATVEEHSSLESWRTLTRMDVSGATATVKFLARVPQTGSREAVRFSSYAFNEDRVKSETASCNFLPSSNAIRRGKAYIVTIGVGANTRGELNLLRAAGDARSFIQKLSPALGRDYEEVVPIPLIASAEAGDSRDNEVLPSKANIQSTFQSLNKIQPEDILIIMIAAHGKVTKGQFAFSAYDEDVSANELTRWLYGVDAGQILLILDTCYAEAALGLGFKPAPLGDPTLGQLSFDKGMMVLVSSSSEEEATAPSSQRHSRLMEALIEEGLNEDRAFDQAGHLDLHAWLRDAVELVPGLESESNSGFEAQTPRLLDFSPRVDSASEIGSNCVH